MCTCTPINTLQRGGNRLGLPSQKSEPHELGAIAAIATAAAALVSAGVQLFGRKKPRTCKGLQQEVEALIRRYLTDADRRELVLDTESNVSPTASEMARFFVGGKDCKHKNVSQNDDRFLNELPKRIALRQQQEQAGIIPGSEIQPSGQPVTSGFGVMQNLPIIIIGTGATGVVLYLILSNNKKEEKKKS